jgi:fatty-acyl-CoA synthase
MTETSPLCVFGKLQPRHAALSPEQQTQLKLKQGTDLGCE